MISAARRAVPADLAGIGDVLHPGTGLGAVCRGADRADFGPPGTLKLVDRADLRQRERHELGVREAVACMPTRSLVPCMQTVRAGLKRLDYVV